MCIVDPSDEYLLVAALDLLALILKHADAHRFKGRQHPNGVVVAEHAEKGKRRAADKGDTGVKTLSLSHRC